MQMARVIKHSQKRKRGDKKKFIFSPSFLFSLLPEFKHIIKGSEKKSNEIQLVVANED